MGVCGFNGVGEEGCGRMGVGDAHFEEWGAACGRGQKQGTKEMKRSGCAAAAPSEDSKLRALRSAMRLRPRELWATALQRMLQRGLRDAIRGRKEGSLGGRMKGKVG